MSQIDINASLLKGLLEAVKPAIHRNSPLPVATHVRVTVSDGIIALRSTDGSLYLTATADLAGQADVDFCVSPERMAIALAACHDDITIEVQPGQVTFKNGRSRLKALTIDAELFPEPTAAEFTGEYVVTGFGTAIEQALFVVDPANVRPQLTGLWLDSSDAELTMVGGSIGGVTLAAMTVQGEFESHRIMLPHAAAKLASRFNEATVLIASNRVKIISGNVTLECPPASVPQLPWQKAIPATDQHITVSRAALLAALNQCNSFKSGDKINYVVLAADGEQLTVKTACPGEEYETHLPCTGDVFEAGFNTRQLLDGINHAAGEEITLSWSSAGDPKTNARLLAEGGWRFVVMPLKL